MNDELEQRLAALVPAALPPEVQERLTEPPVARGKIRWLWAFAPLSAAALWFFTANLEHPAPHSPPAAQALPPSDFHVFLPVKETSTLVGVEDLTVLHTESEPPVRLVRARWIDDVTYAGDDGHSTIHRRKPREQIIPIALETY